MKVKQLIEKLSKLPAGMQVILQNGDEWVEVLGVVVSDLHHNACTFKVVEEMSPGVPGVIVYTEQQS